MPMQKLSRVWNRFKSGLSLCILATVSLLSFAYFGKVLFFEFPRNYVASRDLTPKDRIDAENATRTSVIQAVGGFFLVTGAIVGLLNLRTSREGQITDRFSKAVEQLGNDKVEIRLGGIYALERVARDSE